jgi:hypothetical protein
MALGLRRPFWRLFVAGKREENFPRIYPRNPLKSLDSHERIQGNPRESNTSRGGLSQRNGLKPRKPKSIDVAGIIT